MPSPNMPPSHRIHLRSAAIALALGAVMFAVGAVGLNASAPSAQDTPKAQHGGAAAGVSAGPAALEALQQRVRRLPTDSLGWAALGMANVQQGRAAADPATYERAETALRRSLKLQPSGNDQAQTGMAALEAARHEFTKALGWAKKATSTNPYSPSAHGVLSDVYTQLGQYKDAYRTVQRMVDLRPDSASFARASYMWELRGETRKARDLMTRSLRAAPHAADRAFAYTHLALLALENGDSRTALRQAQAGLWAAPHDSALLEARARAYTALGQPGRAVDDYAAAIGIAPLPHYLLGLGELQQSLGRREQADTQYAVLRAQDTIRRANGSVPDVDAILFEADHGDPQKAVTMAQSALKARPFIAVQDAYAWALHRAGRDSDALEHADRALALGTRSALFHFHRGMIHQSLGDNAAARRDLDRALSIDQHFHPLHVTEAGTALSRIDHTR